MQGFKSVFINRWNSIKLTWTKKNLTLDETIFLLNARKDSKVLTPFMVIFILPVIGNIAPLFAALYFYLRPEYTPKAFASPYVKAYNRQLRQENRIKHAAELRQILYLICERAAKFSPSVKHPYAELPSHKHKLVGLPVANTWQEIIDQQTEGLKYEAPKSSMFKFDVDDDSIEKLYPYEETKDENSPYTTRCPIELMNGDKPLTCDEIMSLVPFFRKYVDQVDKDISSKLILSKWLEYWGCKPRPRSTISMTLVSLYLHYIDLYEIDEIYRKFGVDTLTHEQLIDANFERGLKTTGTTDELRSDLSIWLNFTNSVPLERCPAVIMMYANLLISPEKLTDENKKNATDIFLKTKRL